MKFINKNDKEGFFPYLGSRITVSKDGIELSNENRQLLWAAMQVDWLEVAPGDEALAANVARMYDSSLGVEKNVEDEVPELPNVVKFLNESDQPTYVLAHGSKHTVGPNATLTISGGNKELVANAFLNPNLKLVEDKENVQEKVKPLVDKKKELAAKEKEELAKIPTLPQKPIIKENLTQQEVQQQAGRLQGAAQDQAGNNSQMPKKFVNEEQVTSDLGSELEKAVRPNEPGSKPAGGLRVVG